MRSAAVVVPVYGAAAYLDQCVASLLNQDYGNYHIWLVDDLSTDGSWEIAQRWAGEHPDRITLMRNEENLGQGRSRMRAVAASDAEYILFVDSDDYVAPDYISAFMRANTGKEDVIIAGHTRDTDGRKAEVRVPDSPYTPALYAVACCKMFRRAFLTENGIDFSDSRKGEDIYFNLAAVICGARVRVIDYFGYFYRLNRASTTKSMTWQTNFEETVMAMFARLRLKFGDRVLTPQTREILEYAYAANIANALIVYDHGCGPRRMREKRAAVDRDIREGWPDLMRNRQLRFLRPKGVSLKIRLGVGAFYWSRRLRLDGLLFGLLSLI